MKILTDLHTHTLASTHAYSTLKENIDMAKQMGLEAIAVTDHGISMEDAPHLWHFPLRKSQLKTGTRSHALIFAPHVIQCDERLISDS